MDTEKDLDLENAEDLENEPDDDDDDDVEGIIEVQATHFYMFEEVVSAAILVYDCVGFITRETIIGFLSQWGIKRGSSSDDASLDLMDAQRDYPHEVERMKEEILDMFPEFKLVNKDKKEKA